MKNLFTAVLLLIASTMSAQLDYTTGIYHDEETGYIDLSKIAAISQVHDQEPTTGGIYAFSPNYCHYYNSYSLAALSRGKYNFFITFQLREKEEKFSVLEKSTYDAVVTAWKRWKRHVYIINKPSE